MASRVRTKPARRATSHPARPGATGPHRYVFSIDALSANPGLTEGATPAETIEAINGASIAFAELTGTYER